MEQPACGVKAKIGHENTNPRRFSASNFKSFRDDERCLRSTTIISSTASSPGYRYNPRGRGIDEIDPSTYSFTEALKALQARTVDSWEYLPITISHPQPLASHRLALNSKWSDAEKYISNPQSGRVPLECLSAKTLSARSFSTLTNRITISTPLTNIQHQHKLNITIQGLEKKWCTTKDVGTQSTPADDNPSPLPTPATIRERSKKHGEGDLGDSSLLIQKLASEAEAEEREAKERESEKTKEGRERKKKMAMSMCREAGRRGCLSWKGLWKREKCKPGTNNNPSSSPSFLYRINACFVE